MSRASSKRADNLRLPEGALAGQNSVQHLSHKIIKVQSLAWQTQANSKRMSASRIVGVLLVLLLLPLLLAGTVVGSRSMLALLLIVATAAVTKKGCPTTLLFQLFAVCS